MNANDRKIHANERKMKGSECTLEHEVNMKGK
jgi:hypothetical protein